MTKGKKGLTHPRRELAAACEGVSKAALIDCLGDAMDRLHGEDEWRVADLIKFMEPRLRTRGDREPRWWSALRPRPRPPTPAPNTPTQR